MLVILITSFSFSLLNVSYVWGSSCGISITIYRKKNSLIHTEITNNKDLLSASWSFFSMDWKAATSFSSFSWLVCAAWFQRDERRSQMYKCCTGWEDWFTESTVIHYADMLIMDLFCLVPPVASLLAPRVISLPHPPPRCPALGSSSVCCKLCAPPGHPAMPGRQ